MGVTASDGSSSMATVTGATIALLDAGIPIKRPVVGISMGLVTPDVSKNEVPYEIITDILGFVDYFTDMDFKCAGSQKGITAIQLDMKRQGIGPSILKEALDKSRDVRLEMLLRLEDSMVLKPKNDNIRQRVLLEIDEEVCSAGEIIGRRGENLHRMQEEVKTRLEKEGKLAIKRKKGERSWTAPGLSGEDNPVTFEVSNEGDYVEISSESREALFEGLKVLVNFCTPLQVGKIYSGKVIKMLDDVGAVVEIGPGKDGFLHISQITGEFLTGEEMAKYIWDGADVEVEVFSLHESTGRVKFKLHSTEGKRVATMQKKSTGGGNEKPSGYSKKKRVTEVSKKLARGEKFSKTSHAKRRKKGRDANVGNKPKKGAAVRGKGRESRAFRSQINKMVNEL